MYTFNEVLIYCSASVYIEACACLCLRALTHLIIMFNIVSGVWFWNMCWMWPPTGTNSVMEDRPELVTRIIYRRHSWMNIMFYRGARRVTYVKASWFPSGRVTKSVGLNAWKVEKEKCIYEYLTFLQYWIFSRWNYIESHKILKSGQPSWA